MSTRSVKFEFEPGEVVLCFEPDPSKARVLYDAKILELAPTRDRKGRRKSAYLIHFQGWNSSWDRTVAETYVLKATDTNRALMHRIAETSRHVKNNRTRKRRIDQLLKIHFKVKHLRFDSSDSDTDSSSSSSDDEDDDDDDDEDDEEEEEEDEMEDRRRRRERIDQDETDTDRNGDTEEGETTEEDEDPTDGLEIVAEPFELELPENLKRKLEDDFYCITRKKKLCEVPAEPNVITILEGYVKSFAINILCATVDKLRPRDTYPPPPEKNIELCKEVMDSLRITFDFTLPSILLYGAEAAQFTRASTTFKHVADVKKEESQDGMISPLVQSPRLRSASLRSASSPTAEPPSKLLRLSPKQIKKEKDEETFDEEEDGDDDEECDDDEDDEDREGRPPRRMTRHAYQKEIRRTRKSSSGDRKEKNEKSFTNGVSGDHKKGHASPDKSHGQSEKGGSCDIRRRDLRSSGRHPSDDLPCFSASISTTSNKSAASGLSDRVTPPPPLLIPSVINSKREGSSRCSTPTLPDGALSDREGALNGVLAWKLISDESYFEQTPAPPAVLYGAPHLLRLFAKLPDLIAQMPIPESALRPLIKHLDLFVEYMSDRCEDLFPDTLYIDSSENNTKSTLPRR